MVQNQALIRIQDGPQTHPISPYLYGSSWGNWMRLPPKKHVRELAPKTIRVGGILMSRYDWRTSRYSDPFQKHKIAQQPSLLQFSRYCAEIDAEPVIQLNAMEWAPNKKDEFRRCLDVQDSLDLLDHLKRHGCLPKFVEIDSEPFLWHLSHPDAMNRPVSGEEYFFIFQRYASRIKAKYPRIQIMGPAIDSAWNGFNTLYPNDRYDTKKGYLLYFLELCKEWERKNKSRLLDILTIHVYPQFRKDPFKKKITKGGTENFLSATQLWWNPGYKNRYDHQFPMGCEGGLLRTLLKDISRISPDVKRAVTEFNVDAFAGWWKIGYHPRLRPIYLADIFGTLAQEDIFLSNHFHLYGVPNDGLSMMEQKKDGTGPLAFKKEYSIFELYSNHFQGDYLASKNDLGEEGDKVRSHVCRGRDGKLGMIVINKTLKKRFNLRFSWRGKDYAAAIPIEPLNIHHYELERGKLTLLKKIWDRLHE
jgi:hypothetical protein